MLPDITYKTEEKIRKTIEKNNLIKKDQHIVIGLSGGPDSVCLFNALLAMKDEFGISIHPVHVNHKFRPGAAEEDQHYVEELCRKKGLECRSFVVDCNELARETGMTSEEAGRKARYDAFCKVAEELAGKIAEEKAEESGGEPAEESAKSEQARSSIRIAVAQNANDQAETVLFRLLRGTGTDGLAGIAYERDERGFKVIRPLLDVRRSEIEEYCERNQLGARTDHTNEESVYTRNKIRNELIPYIEREYNASITESLIRLSEIAASDKAYLWQQTEECYKALAEEGEQEISMQRQELANLPDAIRHRVIFKAFARIGLDSDVSEERIRAADAIIAKKQGPKQVQFPRKYVLEVAKGRVKMKKL